MGQINVVKATPDTVRGNHFHKRKTEWFLVIKGKAKLTLHNLEDNTNENIILTEDEPTLIKIPPNIAHAIQNIGREDMYFLTYVNETYDTKDADIFQIKLV